MASRPTCALLLACATCTTKPGVRPTTTAPAEVVAVPLTAATAQLAAPEPSREELEPPWSLTASDGSGLVMTRVDAKAVFEGPLAFTELHLYFHNSENRRREGTFQITLPPHAAVSRFAMENDGQWMEAEVVEKMVARRAYDDFLHRKQDPALLEKAEGNQFTAKVFPIPANGDKHIVISYSQELPGTHYMLPLRGLPKIGRVDVELQAMAPDGKHATQRMAERDWQPDRDFVSEAPVAAAGVTSGTLVAAQVAVFDQTSATLRVAARPGGAGAFDQARPTEAPTALTILVDTSASRGLGYAHYVQSVRELVGKLRTRYGDALKLQVVAFDQDAEPIFTGTARDYGAAEDKKLLERGAAGASDLGQALASLRTPLARVLVVTDGVMTAGAERADLVAAVKQLGARSVDRIDVALAGGLRDADLADALVRAGLPHAGAVLDLDGGSDDVALALGEPVRVDIPVEVKGATWVYPRTIATARPGTSTTIYARLAAPTQTLDVRLGGDAHSIGLTGGTAPLVERAVAAAEIDELEQQLADAKPDQRQALRDDIAKRSVAARVVSSQTAMLVLESDSDYARYGIDRKALADVLAIGPAGLARVHRAAPVAIAAPEPTKPDPAAKAEHERYKKSAGKDDELDAPLERRKLAEIQSGNNEDDQQEITGGAAAADQTADLRGEDADGDPDPGQGSAEGMTTPVTPSVQPPLASAPPPPPEPPRPSPGPRPDVVEQRPSATATDRSGAGSGSFVLESRPAGAEVSDPARAPWPPADKPAALVGELAEIEHALAAHDVDAALAKARDWHAREPGDVRALIGLGDALEAKGAFPTAARIYGSIIDLYPSRADMRRFAGERLARVRGKLAQLDPLVVDTYRRAVADRPDHLTGHRLLAYALLRAGKPADAFAAILAGVDQPYPPGRFAGGDRVLADDAGMIGAAYAAAQPARTKEIEAELGKRHLKLATHASTRFILYWETDGNDVDFHIQDARGNHAWYSHKELASGGELYADITTGYGPECFAIQGTPKAGPYHLSIDYFSQGPMGYGMGLLEIQKFDGKGKLTFEDRPYVIMNDHAFVDLGTWK
jgi:hypothetical protein